MISAGWWVWSVTHCLPAGSGMGQALTMLVSLTPSWWHWENAARQSYCCFCPLTANSSNGESKILHCPVILLIIQHHLCSSLFNRTLSLDAIRVRAEYKLYTTFLVLASLVERWKRTGLIIGWVMHEMFFSWLPMGFMPLDLGRRSLPLKEFQGRVSMVLWDPIIRGSVSIFLRHL